VSNMRRTKRLVALAAGLALVAAACGGDDDNSGSAATTAPAGSAAPATTAGAAATTPSSGATETTAAGSTATTASGGSTPTGATAMTITVDLNPKAVWEDGTPITYADLQCTWQAVVNTPGSLTTAGYDQITSVEKGTSDKQAVISLKSVYGPYKTLFSDASTPIIKKAAVDNCKDVSGDFSTEMPVSGRSMKLESWSEGQSVLVPNDKYWGDDKMAAGTKIVFVPQTDSDTEIASLKAGQVDYAYPQISTALGDSMKGTTNKIDVASGGDYEALYFQQLKGPFADKDFRTAFSESIDRQALFDQIYAPIFESAGAKGELLDCGSIVQGPYCPPDNFQNTYDPTAAEKTLTDAGWAKNGDGLWAKDGNVPTIRWMVNTGNSRRENAQAYLIPLLKTAGFNVVADNCESDCVFQQRLPALDYDLGMYINTAPPDPQYLTPLYTCDAIPSEANGNKGQNQTGWCNQAASDALHKADVTVDPDARKQLIFSALKAQDTDHVLLPIVNYPKTGVYNTAKIGGPVTANTANFFPFANMQQWKDVDGDGQTVIGAEQWPSCLNPVTECANSSWYVWTISFPLLPGIWDTQNDQSVKISNLVTAEPVVKVL
jgi:peptide/nickel transport system substrate-binding protein